MAVAKKTTALDIRKQCFICTNSTYVIQICIQASVLCDPSVEEIVIGKMLLLMSNLLKTSLVAVVKLDDLESPTSVAVASRCNVRVRTCERLKIKELLNLKLCD